MFRLIAKLFGITRKPAPKGLKVKTAVKAGSHYHP
jgi:hypothetical protein